MKGEVMVFCSKCGTENPDGVKFCSNCGTVLKGMSDVPDREKTTKKSSKFGTMFAWGFGVLYTICGIVVMVESIIGGLLTAAGGIILIPATRDYIAKTTKTARIPGWLAVCVFFLLMMAGVLMVPESGTDTPSRSTSVPTVPVSSTQDDKLITKSEEDMSLTIDDMPLGWTGSNGEFKYIQSGDFRIVKSKVTKYSSIDEAKAAYQGLMPENTAITNVNFGDEGVGYTATAGMWTHIIFRKANVIVKISGFSEYHTIDMTDIKMLAMAVEKKM